MAKERKLSPALLSLIITIAISGAIFAVHLALSTPQEKETKIERE